MSSSLQPVTRLPNATFPRPMLYAAAGLVTVAIGLAALGHFTHATVVPVGGTAIAMRDIRFVDRADGGIDVTDAATGALIQTVTGQAGFLRGTMRTLASARKRADLNLDVPFHLTAWKDGRLTLDDPTDGRHVELEAFGETNEAAFAGLLTGRETPR